MLCRVACLQILEQTTQGRVHGFRPRVDAHDDHVPAVKASALACRFRLARTIPPKDDQAKKRRPLCPKVEPDVLVLGEGSPVLGRARLRREVCPLGWRSGLMAKEYKTTAGRYREEEGDHLIKQMVPPDPFAPDGEGWRMIGSTAAKAPRTPYSEILWFWERDAST